METKKNVLKNYDFIWKIHDFSTHLDKIDSAVFTPFSNMKKIQLSVSMHYEMKPRFQCRVFLKNPKLISYNLRVNFDLKFTSVEGLVLSTIHSYNPKLLDNDETEMEKLFTNENNYSLAKRWCIFKSKEIPCDDILIVKIHFQFFGHEATTKSIAPPLTQAPQQNLSVLSTDFKNLYNSKALTDITIRINGNVLQAHQAVLVARSPVFKKMLENSFLESELKCLTITDVDSDVFDCFLKYLYSGVVEDKTFSKVYSLYSVADKYAVPSLQAVCGDIIASNLNAENICSVLKLSYLHSDKPLQDKAVNFAISFFSVIKSSPEWNEILKNYPELVSEVLGSIVASFKI